MDKLKTRILLISLLLVLLFSLQGVSATTDGDGNTTSECIGLSICDNEGDVSSDGLSVPYDSNNQDEMLSDNPSTYSQPTSEITSSTDDNGKAGTFTDLNEKLYDAMVYHDGVLDLEYDFAYDDDIDGEVYGLGIPIGGSIPLTINGNNHTISGSKLSGIFIIELDDDVVTTFNDITFADAHAGAILHYDSKLIINNCTFINNIDIYDYDYDEGGAISSWGDVATLNNCVFINNTAADGGAIFIQGTDVTLNNCVFINNTAAGDGGNSGVGGAISTDTALTANNCIFTNNIASSSSYSDYVSHGGAIEGSGSIIITNSSFTNNSADNGSAIWMYLGSVSVENCNFTGNNASYGSAIYFREPQDTNSIPTPNVSNSCFLNNRADAKGFQVTKNKNSIEITFTGCDNLLNAIYSEVDVSVTNVTYWGAEGIANTGSSPIMPSRSNKESGQNITVEGVVNGNILSTTKVTDSEGKIVLDDVNGVYNITVRHDLDSYYTEA